MRYVYILLFAGGTLIGFSLKNYHKAEMRRACNIGWRHSAARYKVYETVEVPKIRADATLSCKDWKLE